MPSTDSLEQQQTQVNQPEDLRNSTSHPNPSPNKTSSSNSPTPAQPTTTTSSLTNIPPQPPSPRSTRLSTQITHLTAQSQTLTTDLATARSQLSDPNTAQTTVRHHIDLLQRYNELKDLGMALLGLIAEHRGVRVKDVLEEFGVDDREE